jgi:CBS domain-containing protein
MIPYLAPSGYHPEGGLPGHKVAEFGARHYIKEVDEQGGHQRMSNYQLTAADIMQTEVVTILGDASIQEAAALMRYEGVRSLLVVPRDGHREYGIITFSDIVNKVLAEKRDPRQITVDEVATARAQSIAPNMEVHAIARLFRQQHFGHAPVLDGEGHLLGIVSMTDLMTEVITEPD